MPGYAQHNPLPRQDYFAIRYFATHYFVTY